MGSPVPVDRAPCAPSGVAQSDSLFSKPTRCSRLGRKIFDVHRQASYLHTAEDAMVLVVANPSETDTCKNLLAPIVVNVPTGACSQVILDGRDWPLQAELATRSA